MPAILTRRLELTLLGRDLLAALLLGQNAEVEARLRARPPATWDDRALDLFAMRREQLAFEPDQLTWLLRAMIERTPTRRFAGYINFHAPPNAWGMVEIGYTVLPDFRRRGYAEEAARAMFAWAEQQGARTIRAAISPSNTPSLALAAKLDFIRTGRQWDDEDGEELVFERPARLPAGAGR